MPACKVTTVVCCKKTPASCKRPRRCAIAKSSCADRFALARAAYARANRGDPIYACTSTGARRGCCVDEEDNVLAPCPQPKKKRKTGALRKV